MGNFLEKIYNLFFLSPIEKILYKRFFRENHNNTLNNKIILIQCVEDYYYYGIFGLIINTLKEKHNIHAEQYVLRNLAVGSSRNLLSFTKSLMTTFLNKFKDNKWIKLYSSYCEDVAYRNNNCTSILLNLTTFLKACTIFKNIKSKEELLSLVIDDIEVGDLIYDSYLRFKPAPTVNINNFYLLIIIWNSIRNISTAKKYFHEKRPLVLLTSYSTYIQHGITVRIAISYGTCVYSFGNYHSFEKHLTNDDWYHTVTFRHYLQAFSKLENKKEYLEKAKVALEHRLNGGKDTATFYMKESAYKVTESIKLDNLKNHIVIFLHDFFDSPHVYGNMVFNDFLEWIEFTIQLLEKLNIPYCLKPHPNQRENSSHVIERLKREYPKTTIISSKITNKQLVDAGISMGISVHGTIAHELVYMGIPIILCADNPHASYNFCFQAKNLNEYINLITNYKSLTIINEAKTEIESFYYMHNLNHSADMLNLLSNLQNLREITENLTLENLYNYTTLINRLEVNQEFTRFITKIKKIL